jgi:thiamine-monophosphate kinase
VKLSERELIARWRQLLPRAHGRLRLGIGDDAALYDVDDESVGIFTTDMLVQDVHFKENWGTYGDVGWKSVAVNVSDIAAMGGEPRLVLIAAALPATFDERDAEALLRGAHECAGAYGAQIAGGDTVRSTGPLVVSVAVFGEAVREEVLRRDTARVGDLIATTGSYGGAAAALRLYRERRKPPTDLASRLHRPLPRVEEGQLLARAGVRCGIDCSDGLLRSLDLLCEASAVTASVEEERVPVDPSATRLLGVEAARELALTGGEDYELVVTASEDVLSASGARLTIIGEIVPATSSRVLLRRVDGSVRLGVDEGYDAFR